MREMIIYKGSALPVLSIEEVTEMEKRLLKMKWIKTTKDIPWCGKSLEEQTVVTVVNGILDLLKENHIKRNQVQEVFSSVDAVLKGMEI